jgi:cell division protein FtsB
MLTALAWLVKNPFLVVAIALTILAGGLYVDRAALKVDIAHHESEIVGLKLTNKTLERDNSMLDLQIATTKNAQAALEAALTKQVAREQSHETIQKEIDHAPPTDNAPVAPVLRRALERM